MQKKIIIAQLQFTIKVMILNIVNKTEKQKSNGTKLSNKQVKN